MRRVARVVSLLLATALIALPVVASAAEKPTPWKVVDVTVHTDQGNMLLISGELPESVKLPAEVELAVPTGGQLQWAGEILGGPVADDPTVDYEVSSRDGMDVYSFTLTKSRTGQIEVSSPQSVVFDGQTFNANVSYTAISPIEELRFNIRIPSSATIATPAAGATIVPGPQGFSYYQKVIETVEPGQSESVAFGYNVGAASVSGTAGSASNGVSPVMVVVVLLFGAAIVFAGMAVRRKMQGGAVAEAYEAKPARAERSDQSADTEKPTAKPRAAAVTERVPDTGAKNKKTLAVGLIIAAFVIGGVLAVNSGGAGIASGNTIVMEYAAVDNCASTSFALSPTAGGDLEQDGQRVLESLRSLSGIGNATLFIKEARVDVNYCGSSATPEQIVAAIGSTGYSAVVSAPAQQTPITLPPTSSPATATP